MVPLLPHPWDWLTYTYTAKASSAVLTRAAARPSLSCAAAGERQDQFSCLPQVASDMGEGHLSLTITWLTWGGSQLSHTQGRLTCAAASRVGTTVMPRQSAGPALRKAAATEVPGQLTGSQKTFSFDNVPKC